MVSASSFYLTLMKLFLQIRVDGQDVREVTLESLRRCMGVVPQDTVSLTHGTFLCYLIILKDLGEYRCQRLFDEAILYYSVL